MAIWSRPLKWVKSKIVKPRAQPPAPPPQPPKPPPAPPRREPEPPDDNAFNRLHAYYIASRIADLGMDSREHGQTGAGIYSHEEIDALIARIGAKNAIKVLDQQLARVRDYLKNGTSPFSDSDDRASAWEKEMHAQIKRYTPKGELPNYTQLMPFWWYHPTRP
jgi:hypothetical protein